MVLKFVRVLGSFTAAFSGFVYFAPNTIFLDKIQEITQQYKHAVPVPVSLKVKRLMEEVMNDMKLDKEEREKIELFTCWGFDNFYAGSIWKNKYVGEFAKAIVGIPVFFNWDTVSKEDKENIIVKNKKLNWASKSGEELEKSLILSDKANKFAMAQQIFYISTAEPLIKAVATSVIASIGFICIHNVLKFDHFSSRNAIKIKSLSTLGIFTFNFMFWVASKDVYRCTLEAQADKATAELGKEYVVGGFEYFSTMINRNVAMRTVFLEEGEKTPFSLFGNEEMMIRQKHLPLVSRRDYFQKLLKEKEESSKS